MLKNKTKELKITVIKKLAEYKKISYTDAELFFNSLSQKKKRKLLSNLNEFEG